MKTKILLWSVVSVLTVGVVGLVRAEAPQVIHLEDGTKLTLLGTTYGSHHVAPGYEYLATGNWFYTATNTTVVWIEEEHDAGKWPSYELLVYDQANTACVNIERRQGSSVNSGVSLQSFVLYAFPRLDKSSVLRVKPYTGKISQEQFVITNPAMGAVTEWTPEPLPSKKSDGDLDVTLNKLVAGAPVPHPMDRDHGFTNDPANQCVHLNFDFRQNGQPTTNWSAWPVGTSDAAGNHVRGLIYGYPKNGLFSSIYPDHFHPSFPLEYDGYYYRPGLWPDEPAWKVRLEFIQRSGFSDDEIVTFTNLPVRPGTKEDADDQWSWDVRNTNWTFIAQARVNGMQMKLLPPLLVTDSSQGGQKSLRVLIFSDSNFNPEGKNVTVLQATDDQGRDIWSPFGVSWAGHYNIELPNVRDAKTLNLKLALHKSRFVEFTVKPEKP